MLCGKFLFHLLLLSSVQFVVAIPLGTPSSEQNKSRPQTKTSSERVPQTPSQGINWKALRPILGATGLIGLLAGMVIIGTKLDKSHARALEAHKREQFQKLVDSRVWLNKNGLPESISGEEKQAIKNVATKERAELVLEEQRHKQKVETLRRDIIVKYFDEVERIEKNHRGRKGYYE